MIRYVVRREHLNGIVAWVIRPVGSHRSTAIRRFEQMPQAVARLEAIRLAGSDTGVLRVRRSGGVAVLDMRSGVEQPFRTWEEAACFLLERHLRSVERAVAAAVDSLLERTSRVS